MLSAVTTVGLLGLIALGVWGVSARYLATPAAKRGPGGRRGVRSGLETELIAASASRGVNLLVVAVETVAVALGIVTAGVVVLEPTVPVRRKAFIVLALLLGITLIGDALSIRLGFRGQFRRNRDPLARAASPAVAEAFDDIQASLASARGDGLDDVTVGVLAAAAEGEDIRGVTRWGERAGVGDPEQFHARVDELVAAGLIEKRDGRLCVGDAFAGADPAQIATAAESVVR